MLNKKSLSLTKEAIQILTEFFVTIRQEYCDSYGNMPLFTTRHLKSLKSIAETFAKLRNSDVVSENDAECAIVIAEYWYAL